MNNDLVEEQNAAKTIIAQLAGKPIIGTSGDENHRLAPQSVEFSVGLTEKGDELKMIIKQGDRHHPHLVYDTIKEQLGQLEELKNAKMFPLDAARDYDPHTGKMVFCFELEKGGADSVIHKLSEKSPNPSINIEQNKVGDAIAQVIEFFSAKNPYMQVR